MPVKKFVGEACWGIYNRLLPSFSTFTCRSLPTQKDMAVPNGHITPTAIATRPLIIAQGQIRVCDYLNQFSGCLFMT